MITAGQLLAADCINLGWGELAQCRTNEEPVLPAHFLQDTEYEIRHTAKKQRKDLSNEMCMVAIMHQGTGHMTMIQAGDFLFKALYEFQLMHVLHYADEDGKIYGPDYKVWHSVRLFALANDSFPTVRSHEWIRHQEAAHARGNGASGPGLDIRTVWQAVTSLSQSRYVEGKPAPLLVHPWTTERVKNGALPSAVIRQLRTEFARGNGTAFFFILEDEHWALLATKIVNWKLNWQYFDGLDDQLFHSATQIAAQFGKIVGVACREIVHENSIRQVLPHTCGTVAIAHFASLLGLQGHFSNQIIAALHDWLLMHQGNSDLPKGYGWSDGKTIEALASLLCEKGVPADACRVRAQEAIAQIGLNAVQQALLAKNKWQALKAQASRPNINYKFLKPHELADFIETKAKEKFGAVPSKKKGKGAGKSTSKQIEIDPSLLRYHPDHFVDNEGKNIPQIDLGGVVAGARGLAICQKSDALRFLEDSDSISADALGLLITTELTTHEKGTATVTALRFCATYIGTQEQVIVNGSLLSLGDVEIKRHIGKGPGSTTEVIGSQILRLQVYRDELAIDWAEFTNAPIKQLISVMPQLQLCEGQNCGSACKRYHAPVDTQCNQVLQEVWARRFHAMEGKTVPAIEADGFSAFIRVAKPAKELILKVTIEGIYMEPRSESPPGPDRTYAVVWLPQMSRDDVLHRLRTTSGAIAMTRLKMKYGLRVLADDEESVHTKLKPQISFMKMAISKTFVIQPLPHGITRASVEGVLRGWGWTARPLQPHRSNALGAAWLIGSDNDPPANVLTAFGVDVIVNPSHQRPQTERKAPVVQASRKTQKHMQETALASSSQPSSSSGHQTTDPWQLGGDPWGRYKAATGAGNVDTTTAGQKKIDEVAAKLKAEVRETVRAEMEQHHSPDATMGDPDLNDAFVAYRTSTDARFKSLESGIQELRSQGQTVQQWMQQAGARMDQADQLTLDLQREMQQVHTEVKQNHENVQHSIQVSFATVRSELTNDLGAQLAAHFDSFDEKWGKKQRKE